MFTYPVELTILFITYINIAIAINNNVWMDLFHQVNTIATSFILILHIIYLILIVDGTSVLKLERNDELRKLRGKLFQVLIAL